MENLKEVFEYNGKFYEIEKSINESREMFVERVWFILNKIHDDTFDELVKKSRIWSNEKNLKCEYFK